MKKFLMIVFSFLFISTALVGGSLLLSGCDSSYSDPSNDSGGGSSPTDENEDLNDDIDSGDSDSGESDENIDNPGDNDSDNANEDIDSDDNTNDDDSDDDVSANAVNFSVEVRAYVPWSTSAVSYSSFGSNYIGRFSIYWFEGDGGSDHGRTRKWGNTPTATAAYGYSVTGNYSSTNYAGNLVDFSYSYGMGVQRYANVATYKSSNYALFGVSSSTSISSSPTSNTMYYIYGRGSTRTSAPTSSVGTTMSGTWYVKYKAILTMSFSHNGGSGSTASKTFYAGNSVSMPSAPTRAGYVFSGWRVTNGTRIIGTYNANATVNWSYLKWSTRTNGSYTYAATAQWTPTYTLSYNGNGATGGSTSSQTVNSGTSVTVKECGFTRTNYDFTYWSTTSTGGTRYDPGDSITLTSNVTLYARWTYNPPVYTYYITYNSNYPSGTDETHSQAVRSNSSVSILSASSCGFSYTGYNFSRWTTNSNGTGTSYYTGNTYYGSSGSDTLYAQWTRRSYTITFNGNGATGGSTASQTKYYGSSISLRANGFTRTGYTFQGWATSPTGGVVYADGGTYSANASDTLYAVWKANSYTVTWNGNGTAGALLPSSYWNYAGSSGYTSSSTGNNSSYSSSTTAVTATSSVTYNSAISYKTPIPIRSGYTFNGWYTAASGGVKVADNAGNMLASVSGYTDSSKRWIRTGTATFYAQWSAKSYSITYNLNSGSLSSRPSSYTVASSQTIGTPTRAGYNFSGWSVQMNLDKLYSGQIDQNTGVQSYNSTYPNAVYYEMFYMVSGVSYTAATSGGQVRFRAFSSSGTYSRSSGAVTLSGANEYAFLWYHLGSSNATMSATFTSSGSFTTGNYKLVGDLVVTANWTPAVYTVTLNKNGGSGGTSTIYVKYATGWYSNSGATTSITSVTVPTRTGFTFNGYYTATSGGTRIIDGSGKIVGSNTYTTSNDTLYAQWTARNPAHYDSEGGYWYIENGYMPQSRVTNSTTKTNLNNSWNALPSGSTYEVGGIGTLQSKTYQGKEYCKYNNEYYLVEPIKWRLDYSSSQKSGYGTTTDTLAILDTIVYVNTFSTSAINAGSGYSSTAVNEFYNSTDKQNQFSTTYLVSWTQSMNTFGTSSLYGNPTSVTSNIFVSSVEEIESVAGSGEVKFSDLVTDYLYNTGNDLLYYTRDLGSNYNNIVCLNKIGSQTQRMPNLTANRLGVQFTIKVTEYACV